MELPHVFNATAVFPSPPFSPVLCPRSHLLTSVLCAASGSRRARFGPRTSGLSVPGAEALQRRRTAGDDGKLSVQACLALLLSRFHRRTSRTARCSKRYDRHHHRRTLMVILALMLTKAPVRTAWVVWVSQLCSDRHDTRRSACPSRSTPTDGCRS